MVNGNFKMSHHTFAKYSQIDGFNLFIISPFFTIFRSRQRSCNCKDHSTISIKHVARIILIGDLQKKYIFTIPKT